MSIQNEYLQCVIANFKTIKDLGEKTISQLDIEELHWCPTSQSNSIAIIIKHLSGNMLSRWTDFLTTDGEKPNRNRDDEFKGGYPTKKALLQAWENGWNTLFTTLHSLTENDLLKTIYIRGEAHSVVKAIQRQISHYSYHIGQIVYIGKQIKNENWSSLSIPKGKSIEYLEDMLKQHQQKLRE
ncbi:DUF1572 domain-containing protein [Aneurinibacillus thermoaerophilus]|uniref:DUF1572 domain-containing protein n=1 Tax=Aneurinibacillus thermoaerophilus TaxID=143495 RepID=UPI002E1F252F|nr:DUF1572 domain-containing protein [Aneurinibacillus thermoaerophilus]